MSKERIKLEKKYWDKEAKAPDFERRVADVELNTIQCLKAIHNHIPEGNILEIGCGIGRLTLPMAIKNPTSRFIGVDISKEMIKIAKNRAKELKVKNVEFKHCNGRELPNIKNLVGAYSMITFQHITEDGVKSYIKQVGDMLLTGGVFRFQFVEGDENSAFSQQYKKDQMKQWLIEAGFEVDFDSKFNYYYSPNWIWITATKI